MPCEYLHKKPYSFERPGPRCQFDEVSTFKFAGKSWCQFHLPMVDEFGNESEKSSWSEARAEGLLREIKERLDKFSGISRIQPDLGGVVFPGPANFNSIQFSDRTTFDGAYFHDIANFSAANFSNRTSFAGARFFRGADFRNTVFTTVSFDNCKFMKDARFDQAAFRGTIRFRKAHFYSEANFGGEYDTSDSSRRGFQRCAFDEAEFWGRVTFNYRQFFDTVSFHGAMFSQAPEFHNCILHPDTDFSNLHLPQIEPDWRAAKHHYRTLKRLMGGIQARDDEAMFYAREQRCLRALKDTPGWVLFASAIYSGVSDYGQSALRPFLFLIATTFISFMVYAGFAADVGPPALKSAFGFTLEQIVRPFSVLLSGYQPQRDWVSLALKVYPIWLLLVTSLQSILNLSFLAFFFLALRWRFRRG